MTPPKPQEQKEPIELRDLSLFWRGRAKALRVLDSQRDVSDAMTIETAKVYEECAAEIQSALNSAPPSSQSGDWVLVPREPTEAMLIAGDEGSMLELAGDFTYEERARIAHAGRRLREYADAYRAMINAAPPSAAMESEREAFEQLFKSVNERGHDVLLARDESEAYQEHWVEDEWNWFQLVVAWSAHSARTTDAGTSGLAEKIFAAMMNHWFALPNGESVRADVLVGRIAAIIAAHTSAPAALPTLTEEEIGWLKAIKTFLNSVAIQRVRVGPIATHAQQHAHFLGIIISRLTGQRS